MHVSTTSRATEWATVPGYGGKYRISRSGVIRSVDNRVVRSNGTVQNFRGRVTAQHIDSEGYKAVRLTWMGKSDIVRVHRLLAEVFIPNPEYKPVVRHLNDDKTDLRLENLAWGTAAENIRDCLDNGHHKQASQDECGRGHRYTVESTYFKKTGGRDCRLCAKERRHKSRRAA